MRIWHCLIVIIIPLLYSCEEKPSTFNNCLGCPSQIINYYEISNISIDLYERELDTIQYFIPESIISTPLLNGDSSSVEDLIIKLSFDGKIVLVDPRWENRDISIPGIFMEYQFYINVINMFSITALSINDNSNLINYMQYYKMNEDILSTEGLAEFLIGQKAGISPIYFTLSNMLNDTINTSFLVEISDDMGGAFSTSSSQIVLY